MDDAAWPVTPLALRTGRQTPITIVYTVIHLRVISAAPHATLLAANDSDKQQGTAELT